MSKFGHTSVLVAVLSASVSAQPRTRIDPVDPTKDTRSATVIVAAADSRKPGDASADFHCDGTEDQATIARAVAALPQAGGTVCLLEGTFRFQAPLHVGRDNVAIVGQGRGTTIFRPVIANSANGAVIEVGTAQRRARGVRIASMQFQRAGYIEAGYTIVGNKAADFEVTECRFSNLLDGILFRDVNSGAITRCQFRSVYRPVRLSGASNVRITGNHAKKTGTHFIVVGAGDRHDAMVRTEEDIIITENFIESGGDKAITCDCQPGTSVTGVTISGNHIAGVRQGIQLGRGARRVVVNGNVVRDCTGVGLYVLHAGNSVALTNNRVSGCSEGVMLGTDRTSQVENSEVRGNTIEGNNIGIMVGNAKRPVITGNTIRNNNRAKTVGYGILVNAAAQQVVIEGNQFSGHAATGRSYGIIVLGNRPAYAVVRNNVFWGAMGTEERGVVVGGPVNELLVMTDNYFHNYKSIAHAVGAVHQNGDYRGSRVFDGTKWVNIR